MIRQPIICVMGHVDHGKTSLLDKIRSTTIANKEHGGITQHIGASEVPLEIINKICGPLLKKFGANIVIPGLLFVDTPGHEAFTNLRKRGGSVADLAILVVDITKGFEPQTYEAIDILKEYKTPFIVAANKIDLIFGWKPQKTASFLESLNAQQPQVASAVETKLYETVGKLSEVGFNSERFDRVTDFKQEIVMVPVSAKTGEGVAELLVYATGLSQKFLGDRLNIEADGPAKGSIIEKKEERGLGTTADVVLYGGTLKVNDVVAFATETGLSTAKVKALLKPKPLQELRESSSKFYYIDSVSAAAGIKISGTGFDEALPGSLLISTKNPNYKDEILGEMQEVFATEKTGIILKADSIGTLEAISRLLKGIDVKISKKGLGNITKRDVFDAFAMRSEDPYSSLILAFNVQLEPDAEQESMTTGVKIINQGIIYKIIDDYKEWLNGEKLKEKNLAERSLPFPGKIKILPNHAFRMSHPAVFGVDVVVGRVKPSYLMMKSNGDVIGRLKGIEDNGTAMQEAKKGQSVAVSMDNITFGRQIKDDDELYTFINDEEEKLLRTKFAEMLDDEEKELLDQISEMKRQKF